MELSFVRADVEREMRRLQDFDRKIFSPADRFPAAYWRACEVWWMTAGGRRAGCCALQRDTDFFDDIADEDRAAKGVLYISSTAIRPAMQGRGLGRVMKAWQVAYARHHGFRRIVTNTRASNERMIRLNQQFGFRIVRTTPDYYAEPDEPTVVLELAL